MDSNQTNPSSQPSPAATPNADNHTLLAVIAYIGPLVIFSLIFGKDVPFVKFHAKQGLVLFITEIILGIVASIFWQLWMIWHLINFATLVLSIIGIVNVVHHNERKLPLVGEWAQHFKF